MPKRGSTPSKTTRGITAIPGQPAARPTAPGETEATGTPARLVMLRRRAVASLRDPVTLAIMVTTLVALGLRAYRLSRPGLLLGVTEYDDGPYFGSAVRFIQGFLPYRDFVFVQPPGITLLMLPVALIAKVTGTAWGLAVGRILTVLASTAGVVLLGSLVRHRGAFATLVACGVLAVFPDSVAAAHTVLVEPWLVLFCLAGAVAVMDRDRLATGQRLAVGGVAFGFAGAVEGWAIVPVLVVFVLCLTDPMSGGSRLRRAAPFVGGVAAAFCLPVLPFALGAPRGFYQSLVVAQVGPRTGAVRIPLSARLYDMTGLTGIYAPVHVNLFFTQFYLEPSMLVWFTATILVGLVVGVPAVLYAVTRKPPSALEWFALATTGLVVAMFLWPSQFHYHFAAFLAPFLGLAIALPAAKLAGARRAPGRLAGWAAAAVVALIAVCTIVEVRIDSQVSPVVGPSAITAVQRIIPPGACVVSDNVSLLLLANRFVSDVPGCSVIDDGLGTDLALSHGLTPVTGAGAVPAVARVWRYAFSHAGFIWFSEHSWRRIAWSSSLLWYFRMDFRPIRTDRFGDTVYQRVVPASITHLSGAPWESARMLPKTLVLTTAADRAH